MKKTNTFVAVCVIGALLVSAHAYAGPTARSSCLRLEPAVGKNGVVGTGERKPDERFGRSTIDHSRISGKQDLRNDGSGLLAIDPSVQDTLASGDNDGMVIVMTMLVCVGLLGVIVYAVKAGDDGSGE